MYKERNLDRESEASRNIKVVRYGSVEELLEAMYDLPMDELLLCKHGGCDGQGKEYEYEFTDLIETLKERGLYGFARDKEEIHIWVESHADPADVISMLAHERGHLMRPHHRNMMDEEIKAELYGLCANFAYSVMMDLTAAPQKLKKR